MENHLRCARGESADVVACLRPWLTLLLRTQRSVRRRAGMNSKKGGFVMVTFVENVKRAEEREEKGCKEREEALKKGVVLSPKTQDGKHQQHPQDNTHVALDECYT